MQFLLDLLQQRPECLGLTLGHTGGRFVQAQDLGVEGKEAGQLHDPTGSRGEFGYEAVRVAAQAQEVDQVRSVGGHCPF